MARDSAVRNTDALQSYEKYGGCTTARPPARTLAAATARQTADSRHDINIFNSRYLNKCKQNGLTGA